MKKILSVLLSTVLIVLTIPTTVLVVKAETEGYYTYTVENGEATITEVANSITGDIVTPSMLGGYPVTSIGERAFFYCYDLTGVTISEGVRTIGYAVFGNCHSLKTVIVPESIEVIDMYAFSTSTVTNIVLPDKEIHIGYNAFLDTVYYDDSSNWENNALYIGKHLVAVGNITGDFSIKEDTLSLASDMFASRSLLNSIEIPNSIKTIGRNMFFFCKNLTKVIIPDSVTYIDESAFRECPNIVIFCNENSYAETYAVEQGISYRIIGKDYPGDTTVDGKINLSDATVLLQYIAKWDVTLDTSAADVTDDGVINLSDVTRLLQYIAKWDVTLG